MPTLTRALNTVFPSHYYRGPELVALFAGLALYATLIVKIVTSSSTTRLPEAFFTLLFFYALFRNWSVLRHDPGIKLLGLSILLPILFLGFNYLRDPVTAMEYESLDKLVRLMLFIPVAWWLGGHERNILSYLVAAFLGLLLGVAMDPNLSGSIERLLSGRRVDFDIRNAQHGGLYFTLALIGFLAFGHRGTRLSQPALKIAIGILIAAGVALSFIVVIGTQTRAAWLALAVCGAVFLVRLVVHRPRNSAEKKKQLIVTAVAALLLIAIGTYFKTSALERISRESETVQAIVSGDFENIPYSSMGVRVNTWLEAAQWIRERPLIGWGGGVRHDVIDQSERLPEAVKRNFGHFHNTYLEFTLAYGLLGLMVILATYSWILYKLIWLHRRGQCPTDVLQFSGYTMLVMAIMNLFESYLFFASGVYVSMIVLAPGYAVILRNRMVTADKPEG